MAPSTSIGSGGSISQKSSVRGILIYQYGIALVATGLITGASFALQPITGHAAVALLYLLLVVIAGLTLRRGPVLFVATSSALLWDFLINPPWLSFFPLTVEDTMFFVMFFVVALALGHVTSRLRQKEIAERMREQRTATLYDLVQRAGLASDLDSGLREAIRLIESLFAVRAALSLRVADESPGLEKHPASSFALDESESEAVSWTFTQSRPAGKFTENFSDLSAMHLPLEARNGVMGVISILPKAGAAFDPAEKELLQTFAVLIGTILEKDHLLQNVKRAEILQASEHLQRALIHSVSHELKTPLAAVHAGVDALAREASRGERAQVTLREIQRALGRLHRVINNLLDMSRIESGVVRAKLDWCDTGELVQAAMDLAADAIGDHCVILDVDNDLPIVKVDQALLEQCLCNLLLNAASNSPAKTQIVMRARVANGQLVLSVIDQGNGISDADLPHIFETFHRGPDAPPGGTGLGLAIVDGFVRAHGGSVTATNREQNGAAFVITIPVETLRPDLLESFA